MVKNFSKEEVPDEVYLYLALGSNFCPTSRPEKHDFIFDGKEFCRKLAWSAYFENQRRERETAIANLTDDEANLNASNSEEEDTGLLYGWGLPQKLKTKSRSLPEFNDNLLTSVTEKIKDGIKSIVIPRKRKHNLTPLEAKGQKWCRKAIKERKVYITKVDKGGCILILNAVDVDTIMKETLNEPTKFEELEDDPRDEIRKQIKATVIDLAKRGFVTLEEVLSISGHTKRGGTSRAHEFVVTKPYMYPLFKLHKLTPEDIKSKTVPPTRMVTSGVGGPTYRLGLFLDALLKPVVQTYCQGELIRDSTDFLVELQKLEQSVASKGMKLVGTLDVNPKSAGLSVEGGN